MADHDDVTARPTDEDMRRDLAADLARASRHYQPENRKAWKAACRRAMYAEAILNRPVVALFADGREPTTNERHLLSLLSWREKEAADAKAEVARLQALVGSLADRVAGQSEALSAKAERSES